MRHIVVPFRSHSEGWIGGINYFRSLARALTRYPSKDFDVYFLTNHCDQFQAYAGTGFRIFHAPWLDPTTRPDYFLNAVVKTSGLIHPYLYRQARKMDASLITHAMASHITPCPTVLWMQDFQHCHLPEYFSPYERTRRSRNVKIAAKYGHLLFSSFSAAADFRRFFPDYAHVGTHVLRFAPLLDAVEAATERDELNSKYDLPERYFFLPNQFWRHKNHQIVLEALRELQDSIPVICTGALSDARGGSHLHRLKEIIVRNRLQERFITLGIVPRTDFLGLLKYSTCVLNPSLFEGWSSTVEEAKFFGKRMILSDLPVHREQTGNGARYFPPLDAQALAVAMREVESEANDRETAVFQTDLYESTVKQFAHQYWAIAEDILFRMDRQ